MEYESLPLVRYKDNNIYQQGVQRYYRDGVEVEKGVVLTEEYLCEHEDLFKQYLEFFTAYPDLYLDLIKPKDENFQLFFYQRIVIRALMRFKDIYITAPRAFSKSFITILGMILQCIFMPGTKRFICAPKKGQSAQIAKEKITEIYTHWPLIRKEIVGSEVDDTPGNFGKDYVTLKFKNGSQFDVVAPLDSTRGGRRQGGLIDEVRDHDEQPLNEIVLPLLNVSRYLPNGEINQYEPNQQTVFCTSAGSKMSYAYDKLMDVFEQAIIDPSTAFAFGCDYRIPMMHGLLDKNFVNKLKMSPSYDPETFAAEYMSYWLGTNEDSWFSFDKLSRHRYLKNPEWKAKTMPGSEMFYLLSVDVGRLHDQTVVTVHRVNIRQNKFHTNIVNIFVLGRDAESKTFQNQAIDLKKLIKQFNPKEVVIDGNGLGIGFCEEMTREHFDETGEYYPSYGFFNNEDLKKVQPKNAILILYCIKANSTLKSQIQSNTYNRISQGLCHFLIKEQDAKVALMATKIGQKMSMEDRVRRLMPHEMTTKLQEEMMNLRLKRTTGTDIVLEPINTRFPDDKYYSFAYGLWRIKELEEDRMKHLRRRSGGNRQLVFFTDAEGG